MAFKNQDLSVLAYANGFTLWHYATDDAGAVADTSGYFNDVADVIRAGDIIIATVEASTAPKTGFVLVSSNENGVVDVVDLSQIGGTNTD